METELIESVAQIRISDEQFNGIKKTLNEKDTINKEFLEIKQVLSRVINHEQQSQKGEKERTIECERRAEIQN
jgi:hypothetical protein